MRETTPRRLSFVLALALCCALIAGIVPASASPASIKATRKRAAEARSELEELSTTLEMRTEELLAAREALAKTRRRLRATEAKLEAAEREVASAQDSLSDRATSIYRDGSVGVLEVFVGTTDFDDFVSRLELFRRISRSDAVLVSRVKAARADVEATQRALEARRTEQAVLVKRARQEQAEVDGALDAQKAYLARINSKLKRLIAEQKAAEERAAREKAAREAAAAAQSAGGSSAAGGSGRPLPAPRGSVVSIARSYVGKVPYVWGGATPSGFDCSGFTMYVYRQVGVFLPRTSRSQFGAGTRIAPDRLDLLQPGDLVFFGYNADPGQIHHVGIYSGNGLYIHAPQTGEMISESSLVGRIATRGDYVGAVRP